MPDRLHPTDLLGSRVYWLLDLDWAGITIRLSDAEVDVVTKDGTSLHYHGALNVLDVNEGLDFLSDASASPTSVSVDAILPVDVPLMVARGHDLGGATGTLRRWIEGTTYEAARVVVVGNVQDPEFGNEDEPVSFTLELNPWDDSKTIPAPGLILTGTNLEDDWVLSLPAESLGLAYPIVVGHPGVVSTAVSSTGMLTGSQAIPAWLDPTDYISGGFVVGHYNVMWIVAGHHCTARRVYQNSDDFTTAVRTSLFNGRDRAGHPVCYIPWWGITQTADPNPEIYPYVFDAGHTGTYAFTPTDTDGNTTYNAGSLAGPSTGAAPDDANDNLRSNPPPNIYISWNDDIDGGGGLAGDDGELMRDAGSILQWLMSQSGINVDRGRFAAVKSLLSRFKLDFTIDTSVTPWDFISSNLLPILPVSIVSGPNGVYPVVWRYDARAKDAICHIDTSIDPYVERASNVSCDTSNIANDISLSYALSVRIGEYQATARVAPDDSDGATPNYYCKLSQSRYKRPDGSPLVVTKSLESLVVYEDATAHAILNWMSRAYCYARKRVEYIAPEATYGWLERGQVVTITDPDLHWNEQVCLIEAIGTDGSPMARIKLLLVEENVLDKRDVS